MTNPDLSNEIVRIIIFLCFVAWFIWFTKYCDDEQKEQIMKRVILESPYAGDIERNVRYARLCIKDSLLRGEAPIASHLLYTQEGILDDDIPNERKLGIDAGLAWKSVADLHVFYIDYGMSTGMKYALEYAQENEIVVEFRYLTDF